MKPEEIKALRKKMQMSQERFAGDLGVTTHTVNYWEAGKAKPNQLSLRTLKNYASLNKDKAVEE